MAPSNPATVRPRCHDDGYRMARLLDRLGIAARVIGALLGGLWALREFFPTGPTNTVLPPLSRYRLVIAMILAFCGWVIGVVLSKLSRNLVSP